MRVRYLLTFLLIFTMLSPTAVLALGDGKKYFHAGMKHEIAEEWDKAAEKFALAVAENPKNAEYRLHLQRSLFQASQMYMRKGAVAAEQKDYEGAFIAFRKSYAFDPVNELAKSEMARMVRLQKELVDGVKNGKPADDGKVKLVQTSYTGPQPGSPDRVPQKLEVLKQLPFPSGIPLQQIVKDLAKDLDLNVLFDTESRLEQRVVRIDLRNVTAAKALDYIFLQENLFFQKVGPRTILVATGLRRVNFQQLVLRTFYLANASPKDVKAIITAAIPAQPGRSQTIVLEDPSTNSITIRDTSENIQLIGKLIESLDKDRAEVVMDVSIFEVNKNDLMQFGNQIGNAAQLGNLGGAGIPLLTQGSTQPITSGLPFANALVDIGSIALGLPISNLAAFQSKLNTKLLASTQIHAFNNEDSSARIGQRVPVKTASYQTGGNVNLGGVVSDVINYEQIGLTLKFKPIVFPNQDVQVLMDIESKDIVGASSLTPTFTERKISGTARIQNNKTLLLASVATEVESNGRSGLPLLGLIPIIGRLFTAPIKDNRQVDIVIAITPRVIRAPAILPDDLVERNTGSLQTPTSGSLEAMIVEEEKEELLASARRIPTNIQVQLPDQPSTDAPKYVRTDSTSAVNNSTAAKVNDTATAESKPASTQANPATEALNLKPIDTGVKTLQINETADTSGAGTAKTASVPPAETMKTAPAPAAADSGNSLSELLLPDALPQLKKGEKAKIAVAVKGTSTFHSAVLGLKFDDKRLAVRSVTMGEIFGPDAAKTLVSPFINTNGKMFVSLVPPSGNVLSTSGILAIIEVEALADGKVELAFEKDVISFLAPDGRTVAIKF